MNNRDREVKGSEREEEKDRVKESFACVADFSSIMVSELLLITIQ